VQDVLKEHFAGRPVTEQNLSDWKQGGYQDWLRHEESYQLITDLTEQQESLAAAADGAEISDRFATLLSAELVALTRKLLEEKTDPKERWQFLLEVLPEISQLRCDGHRAIRTAIKRERWDHEDEEYLQRKEEERKNRLIDACFSNMNKDLVAQGFGGGEYGKYMANLIHCIKFDLPLPDFVKSAGTQNGHADAAKSEPPTIQPNPA
jgi:hypothetical protein